jgi:hypothetical protein
MMGAVDDGATQDGAPMMGAVDDGAAEDGAAMMERRKTERR